jgi:hypothetical protein
VVVVVVVVVAVVVGGQRRKFGLVERVYGRELVRAPDRLMEYGRDNIMVMQSSNSIDFWHTEAISNLTITRCSRPYLHGLSGRP